MNTIRVDNGAFTDFDEVTHTFTIHEDGDLTIRLKGGGGIVACFARGKWISVAKTDHIVGKKK